MCSEQHYVANYFIRSNRKRILSKEDLAYVKNWISRITEVASITSGCVVVTIVKVREVITGHNFELCWGCRNFLNSFSSKCSVIQSTIWVLFWSSAYHFPLCPNFVTYFLLVI